MSKELNPRETQALAEFGEKIGRVFISKGFSPEYSYVEKARNFIIKNAHMTGNPIDQTINNFTNLEALVDQLTEDYSGDDFQGGKNKKAFKSLSYGCLSFILVAIVALTVAIKSLTPLYEYDEKTKTLKLLGGKFEFEEGIDYQVSVQTSQHGGINLGSNAIKMEGNFPLGSTIDEITIKAHSVDFEFKDSKTDFIYKCQSSIVQKDFIKQVDKKLVLNFNEAAMCKFSIPKNLMMSLRNYRKNLKMLLKILKFIV